MAYLISDKRHGNEVYVTKEALNCGFFFSSSGNWNDRSPEFSAHICCVCYLVCTVCLPLAFISSVLFGAVL